MQSCRALRKAFSLVELLVVIAIIGIRAALLLPTLSKAKAQANSIACKNHLRQMSLALEMYVQEHNHKYPPAILAWWAKLGPYYPLKWTNPRNRLPSRRQGLDAAVNAWSA